MPQKGIIDPNVERTLRKFAELKSTAALARVKNDVISWFRPAVGQLSQLSWSNEQTKGTCPPSTIFQVLIDNQNAYEMARGTVISDSEGGIVSIAVNIAQGRGFVMGDSCALSPTDPQIKLKHPLTDVVVVVSKTTWDGGLLTAANLIDIHTAFETDKAEEKLIETYTQGFPGNSADGIVLSLQIDYLAQAERAYRARATHTFPRTLTHLAAREKGHGQPTGVFLGQALDYFVLLLKQGASASGGEV